MTGACIEWPGSRDRGGYGRKRVGDRHQGAHRVAYEKAHGPIPAGMTVDHLCFNPPCVNPAHLRLLTMEENSRNQRVAFKTHCVNGHEYTPENTYRSPSERRRSCRVCIRERARRYQQRKRAAA